MILLALLLSLGAIAALYVAKARIDRLEKQLDETRGRLETLAVRVIMLEQAAPADFGADAGAERMAALKAAMRKDEVVSAPSETGPTSATSPKPEADPVPAPAIRVGSEAEPPAERVLSWDRSRTVPNVRALPGAAPSPSREGRSPSHDAPRPQPASSPAPPPAAARDMEQTFATRWAVWLGGAALAMGGLLIVRYGIEHGVFGPAFRLALGAAFALLMAGASEYLRRSETRLALPGVEPMQAPAVMAGVAVLSAFGVVYAAHALYGFLGPRAAFAGFAAIGLAALAASLLHGPKFGFFGLLGSYATPLLVSRSEPTPAALGLFVIFVSATAWGLQMRRRSRLMQAGTIAGHAFWALALAQMGSTDWTALLALTGATLAAVALEMWGRGRTPEAADARIGGTVDLAAFVLPIVILGVHWVARDISAVYLVAFMATLALSTLAAIRFSGLADLALVSSAAAIGAVLLAPHAQGALGVAPHLVVDMLRLALPPSTQEGFRLLAAGLAALTALPPLAALLAGWRNGARPPRARGALAFASALAPVGLLLAASLRINALERSTAFAVLALALTAALALASEALWRVERRAGENDDPMAHIGSAAYAAAAAMALGLAIAFGLRETWLVVGFAAAAAGVAFVARARPIPLLRAMAAALATAAIGRALWNPILSGLGDWPGVNWLVVAYGAPAAALGAGAFALSARRDRPRAVLELGAALFGAVFVVFEVVHAFVGADLAAARALLPRDGGWPSAAHQQAMALTACLTLALALLALAYAALRRRTGGAIFAGAETAATGAMALAGALGLGVAVNPLFNGLPIIGQPVFNEILVCYVGPGVALAALAWRIGTEPEFNGLTRILQGLALILGALGAGLIVQHLFSGPNLLAPMPHDARYFAAVAHVLSLLVLAAVVAMWRERRPGATLNAGFAALVALAMAWFALRLGVMLNPFLDGSSTPGPILFNRILWGYGPVAAGFLALAALTRQLAPEGPAIARPPALAMAGALAAALGGFLLVRQALHGPSLHSALPVTLAEAGIYGVAAIAAASLFGGRRTVDSGAATQTAAPDILAVVGYWGLVAIALGHFAPIVGWPVVNNTLAAFLAPAVASVAAALRHERAGAPVLTSRLYGASGLLAGLAYVLMQVRALFPELDWTAGWVSSDHKLRLFAYSFGLISYGVGALLVGFRTGRRDLRLAAIAIVLVATLKVFLLDLAGLEGLWRAASFIGLGLALMGVAYLYRWLLPPEPRTGEEAIMRDFPPPPPVGPDHPRPTDDDPRP